MIKLIYKTFQSFQSNNILLDTISQFQNVENTNINLRSYTESFNEKFIKMMLNNWSLFKKFLEYLKKKFKKYWQLLLILLLLLLVIILGLNNYIKNQEFLYIQKELQRINDLYKKFDEIGEKVKKLKIKKNE